MSRNTRREHDRLDPVLSLVIVNGLGGIVVALAMVSALLTLDVGHLRTLIAGTDMPVVAITLLTFGFAATFATLAISGAVMRIGQDEGAPRGQLQPIPIRVRRDRRR